MGQRVSSAFQTYLRAGTQRGTQGTEGLQTHLLSLAETSHVAMNRWHCTSESKVVLEWGWRRFLQSDQHSRVGEWGW